MPKIFIHNPIGTFREGAFDRLADEITIAGMECEKLPDTDFALSNIWVYAREYDAERVYHGGSSAGTRVISLEVNVIDGALDADAKKEMIARFTDIVGRHAGVPFGERAPVFILIREVPGQNWGMFGKPVTLDAVRNPPAGAEPV